MATPTAECQGVCWYPPNPSANTFGDWEVVSESSNSDMFIHGYLGLCELQQHNEVRADLLAHAPSLELSVRSHLFGQTNYAALVGCCIDLVLGRAQTELQVYIATTGAIKGVA